jgi:hypothetical protein
MQFQVPVKRFKLLAVIEWLPGDVPHAPLHLELELFATDPSVAFELLHEPFLVVCSAEVIWLWVDSVWEHRVVGRMVWLKQ